MKNIVLIGLLTLLSMSSMAQEIPTKKSIQLVDLTLGFGSSQTSLSASYGKNWNMGKSQKFFIGTGIRFSGVSSKGKTFTSAPASLASNPANLDSLFSSNTNFYALNAMLNLGYTLSPKISLGFNIDFIGVSFGPSRFMQFSGNGTQTTTTAKPTSMNILLIGNNDRGTLNSEFYLRYKLNNQWGFKVAMQHFFTELTTTSKVQTLPIQNDRFRNITNLFSFGVAYHF